MSRFFPDNLIEAILIERPNRFVVRLSIEGQVWGASLPNPGKLGELFIPGAVLLVQKMRSGVKYPYRVLAVISHTGETIMLDTHTNNKIAEYMVNSSLIPSLAGYKVKKREVTVGHSRFDLLLENEKLELLYCEIKSCTLFGGDLAMFPDAVTSRGKRHVEELSQMSDTGINTAVVFVLQSLNIKYFVPDFHTDPAFSETLYKNRKKIKIIAIRAGWNEKLELATENSEVPLLWNLYEKEGRLDRGSYLMLLHMENPQDILMADRSLIHFKKGFYLYVSYADQNMRKRIDSIRRKRKNCIYEIDFLSNHSKVVMVWPVRSSENKSCIINNSVKKISDFTIKNFGPQGCQCSSHLHYFKDNPKLMREFQELILDYRMRLPLQNQLNHNRR